MRQCCHFKTLEESCLLYVVVLLKGLKSSHRTDEFWPVKGNDIIHWAWTGEVYGRPYINKILGGGKIVMSTHSVQKSSKG